jgi:FMN-dependent NADH-azoreductase
MTPQKQTRSVEEIAAEVTEQLKGDGVVFDTPYLVSERIAAALQAYGDQVRCEDRAILRTLQNSLHPMPRA